MFNVFFDKLIYDKEYNSYIIYNIDIGYIFLTLFINFDEY